VVQAWARLPSLCCICVGEVEGMYVLPRACPSPTPRSPTPTLTHAPTSSSPNPSFSPLQGERSHTRVAQGAALPEDCSEEWRGHGGGRHEDSRQHLLPTLWSFGEQEQGVRVQRRPECHPHMHVPTEILRNSDEVMVVLKKGVLVVEGGGST
jgi:hypothetical protein